MDRSKSDEQFRNDIQQKYGGQYEILTTYINNREPILVRHKIYNKTFYVTPASLLKAKRCKFCNKRIVTQNMFQDILDSKYIKDEYEILKFKGPNDIVLRHNKCNTVFSPSYKSFIKGHGCPKCLQTNLELEVEKILLRYNLIYETQYSFKDCKNINVLRFDFAVKNIKNELVMLIEADGQYHYQPIYGEKRLKDVKKNDKIKDDYCKNNNIPLIRIPYFKICKAEHIIIPNLSKYLNNKVIDKAR